MNTTLSETNLVWLEQTAKEFESPPETLINVILDRLRLKGQAQGQDLRGWIDAGGKAEAELSESAEAIRKAADDVQAAVKATRLYVSLIEANRI